MDPFGTPPPPAPPGSLVAHATPWWRTTWFTIVALLVVFPVGIWLMWTKKPNWGTWWNSGISAVIAVLIIASIASPSRPKQGAVSSTVVPTTTPSATLLPTPSVAPIATDASTSTPVPTPVPTPIPTAIPTPVPTAPPPPTPSYATFADGTWLVGHDIQAGTYRTRAGSSGCYWERDKDLNGGVESIAANDNTDDPSVVTLLASDAAFKSNNCGIWTTDLSQVTASTTTFGNGDFIVGTDIAPGRYRSAASSGCYWERENNFQHNGANSIIQNDNTDNGAVVQIAAGDKGFESKNCGSWARV